MKQKIKQHLLEMQDLKYQKFHSKLCPNVEKIIGIRVPVLREYAKQLYKNNSLEIIKIDDEYYEELLLQGMIIGLQKDISIEEVIKQIKGFVPKINNWAICDSFCASLKITKKYLKEIYMLIEQYLKSKNEYEVRFAIVMMLDYYINEEYIDMALEKLFSIESNKYYIQMANAWAISICLIKYYNKTIIYLENSKLDKFTHNKAIQKANESYRIKKEDKEYLKKIKKY